MTNTLNERLRNRALISGLNHFCAAAPGCLAPNGGVCGKLRQYKLCTKDTRAEMSMGVADSSIAKILTKTPATIQPTEPHTRTRGYSLPGSDKCLKHKAALSEKVGAYSKV